MSSCGECTTTWGGFRGTREMFLLPQELPFQNREFYQQTTIPWMSDFGDHAMTETSLREMTSRDPKGCKIYEFRDMGNFRPLTYEWQQPDYRPLFFQENSRNFIKNIGRSPCGGIRSNLTAVQGVFV